MARGIESRVLWTSIPPDEPTLSPECYGFHLKFLLTVCSQVLAFTPGVWEPLTRFLEPFAECHKMESCSKRSLGPQVFEVHLSASGVHSFVLLDSPLLGRHVSLVCPFTN